MKITKEEFLVKKKWLVILVTLSIAYIGYGLFGQLYSFFQGKLSPEEMERLIGKLQKNYGEMAATDAYQTFEQTYQILRIQNDFFLLSHFITIAGFTAGLLGVIKMFKGQQMGFHLYIVYSIVACFGVFAYVPFSQIPTLMTITNVFMSLFFIYFYYRFRIWDLEVDETDVL